MSQTPTCERLRWHQASGNASYLTDRVGSVRDLLDAGGLLINHIDYDSFGQVLTQSDGTASDRFLFTARELDANTQQYYYRARYYDPSIGRLTQLDPLGISAGDANLYRYVFNSPLQFTDSSGSVALPAKATVNRVAVLFGAGALGCLLGDLAEGDRDPLDINVQEIVLRGGVFGLTAAMLNSLAKVAPGPQKTFPTGGLAGIHFFIGFVVCVTDCKRSRPALAFSGKSGGQAHFSAIYALAEMSVSRPKNEPDPDP